MFCLHSSAEEQQVSTLRVGGSNPSGGTVKFFACIVQRLGQWTHNPQMKVRFFLQALYFRFLGSFLNHSLLKVIYIFKYFMLGCQV